MTDVEERVDRLEKIVPEFVLNVGIEFNKLYNFQMPHGSGVADIQGRNEGVQRRITPSESG
ncbi:MAG: hypothetical protein KDI73_11890 [Candidatus Competibacteraceae bacterium]|nr:hypothetical protein [Candidatus Competibacteraceae bacterium]HRY14585.1 hypothetical protein [Candidatus Competibacteraceae bacterium]